VGPKPTAIPYQQSTTGRGPSWQALVSRAGGTPAHGTYRAAGAGADVLRQRQQQGISTAKKSPRPPDVLNSWRNVLHAFAFFDHALRRVLPRSQVGKFPRPAPVLPQAQSCRDQRAGVRALMPNRDAVAKLSWLFASAPQVCIANRCLGTLALVPCEAWLRKPSRRSAARRIRYYIGPIASRAPAEQTIPPLTNHPANGRTP